MKPKFLIAICILLSSLGFSQEKTIKKHIVDSETIVGVWQMAGELKMGDKTTYIPMPNLKVYNSDGTFFVMRITKNELVIVSLYGSYELGEDGKMTEYISGSISDPHIVGTKSELKYELEKETKTLTIRYKLAHSENWASEKWIRMVSKLSKQKADTPDRLP